MFCQAYVIQWIFRSIQIAAIFGFVGIFHPFVGDCQTNQPSATETDQIFLGFDTTPYIYTHDNVTDRYLNALQYSDRTRYDHLLVVDEKRIGLTAKLTDSHYHTGNRSLGFVVHGVEPNSGRIPARSELVLIWDQVQDEVYYSAFDMYVPSIKRPYENDIPNRGNIFWQFHQSGYQAAGNCGDQPAGLNPPFTFNMDRYGNFVFQKNADYWALVAGSQGSSTCEGWKPEIGNLFRDDLEKDAWHNYAVQYSSRTGEGGFARVFIDGQLRMVYEGKTAFSNGASNMGKTKIGIYRYNDPSSYVSYFDNALWEKSTPGAVPNNEIVSDSGIVGFWRFDEQSHYSYALDSVDRYACKYIGDLRGFYKNDPTDMRTGSPTDMRTTGKYGGALNLDGLDDYVAVPDSEIWDTGSAVTVSAWFKTDVAQSHKGLVVHDVNNYKYLLYLTNNSRSLAFYIRTDTGTENNVTAAFATGKPSDSEDTYGDGEWHHIVGVSATDFVHDPSVGWTPVTTVKLYVDGALRDTKNTRGRILNGDEGISIGRLWNNFFKGAIDEVKIYDYALSDSEIRSLYNNPLVAYWRFDDDDGNRIARDRSDNRNVAMLMNDVGWTADGVVGSGVEFDGIDDHIQSYADDQVWDVRDKLTLSLWFKTDTEQSYKGLVSRDDHGDYKYMLYLTNNSKAVVFYVRTHSGVSSAYITNQNFADGKWHHAVGVYDRWEEGNRVKLYIDGYLVPATQGGASEGYHENITPGAYRYGDGILIGRWKGNHFKGAIDDVAILRTAMTPNEIEAVWLSSDKDISDALQQ